MAAVGDYPELQVFDIELKAAVCELDEQLLRAIDGQIVHPILVHRVFPGKAALIFRKKYSESRNP